MNRDLLLSIEYPAKPEVVWRAITDPSLLADWLMKNDFRAEVGATGAFCMSKKADFDGNIAYEVLEVDEPRRLVYTWDGGGTWGKTTLVWTLDATETGTRFTLEHRGFHGFKPFILSLMMGSGWKSRLSGRVREIVERFTKENQS